MRLKLIRGDLAPFLKGVVRMFTVNGIEWSLSLAEPYSDNLKRSDNTITLGVTDNNTKTIYINNRLSDAMFDKVLCHELVHVFSFENNLSIPIETEEIIANFMSLYGRDIIYLADDIMSSLVRMIA